jgi:hypothetical protein
MARTVAALLALTLACASSCAPHVRTVDRAGPRLEQGLFYVYVDGKTVAIMRDRPGRTYGPCTLGSAPDPVLGILRGIGDSTPVELTFERMPFPVFGPEPVPGLVMTDRFAVVRGQALTAWCDPPDMYWIHAVRVPRERR